ncbi:Serine/threonine-protein phosphatase 2A activator [Lachancea thermotolerans]
MSLERIDASSATFTEPTKRIFDSRGSHVFQSSVAMGRLKSYLHKYVSSMSGVKIPETSTNHEVCSFAELLKTLSELVDSTPALPGPRRYGNLACRTWHDKVDESLEALLHKFLPEPCHKSIVELQYYLGNAFGSRERLDYGTGHELSFFAEICALDMLGVWGADFQASDVLFLFDKYYALVRKLVLTYTLEPAGSHGVWGLDDHFHLIYIFGASQWVDGKCAPIVPREVQDKLIVDEYTKTNFYCQAISFIFQVKSGPFSEHSPMLFDISRSVPTWSKVQRGLLKMYFAEVLNKFPVVQHFWFGTGLFPWTSLGDGYALPTYEASQEAQGQVLQHTTAPAPTNLNSARRQMNPPNLRGINRLTSQDRFRRE